MVKGAILEVPTKAFKDGEVQTALEALNLELVEEIPSSMSHYGVTFLLIKGMSLLDMQVGQLYPMYTLGCSGGKYTLEKQHIRTPMTFVDLKEQLIELNSKIERVETIKVEVDSANEELGQVQKRTSEEYKNLTNINFGIEEARKRLGNLGEIFEAEYEAEERLFEIRKERLKNNTSVIDI